MGSEIRGRLVTAALVALGAVAGLVVAIIVTLNLHIFLGVEGGYMASPTQVLERSVWILVVDGVVLVAAPVIAIILALRLRRLIVGQTLPRGTSGGDPHRRG